ncbi:dermonecrotic toxin domain-containing protein [Pseudomonas sp. UV AK001]|uniref:dermonecrotic toxin domain-containing protein n=1 Tax=Pseudomonas sp. UV AK001 TaxID=3384791 RepID=UPI0038D4B26F
MIERSFLLSTSHESIPLPGFAPLPTPVDESLLHTAATRRRTSGEGLRQLCAGVPFVRETLNRLLRQKLDLDGELAGLSFAPVSGHPERRVSLVAACAYVTQSSRTEEWLDSQCRLTGVNRAHALAALSPSQMLARIKALAPALALDERWNAYWGSRAPWTPLSCRDQAGQLYRGHIEASAQMAFARGTVTAGQLLPLWSLMGEPDARDAADKALRIELPTLCLHNGVRVKLPAAWVISRGDDAAQLLYVPDQSDAIQAFAKRSDMQTWLVQQPLVPAGLPLDNLRVEYVSVGQSLEMALNEWLLQQQMAQVAALRNGSDGKAGLAEQGPLALDVADRVDRQRGMAVFCAPSGLDNPQSGTQATDEASLFGSLHPDIPWPLRQASVTRSLDALESLNDGDTSTSFEALQTTLEAAEHSADLAARALLSRERVLDLATFNREFTALYDAHKQGLRAEAAMQRALNRLSVAEHDLLVALLDNRGRSDLEVKSLTLSLTESEGGKVSTLVQTLTGPFVLMSKSPIQSLLLYWPGSSGGLQRFADRHALEQQVFKLHASDAHQSLRLNTLAGDPLQHALNELTGEFETQAATIRRRYDEPTQAQQRADELEQLRRKTLPLLQVPIDAARRLALSLQIQQKRSATLATQAPPWLTGLSESERSTLKELIQAWITAMHRSHELLSIALPPREDFTRQHLYARLRQDFSLNGYFSVELDLPDSVALQKQAFSAPGAPGTPQKLVAVPSASRSRMSLETLAQLNIDNTPSMNLEQLPLRLGFMRVEVSATDEQERQTLTAGITEAYLRKLMPELDLPKAYEQRIYDTFKGTSDEPPFQCEHRQECLLEPWRVMLKLQGRGARLQHHIGDSDLSLFETVIDADTADAWNTAGRRIALLPAFLAAGGTDTPNEGPVTLSGVTFIEEQISGTTLLYLPDAPDARFLRRYDSLESARKDLFKRCSKDEMTRYLAGRALQGSVRAHERRIAQAVEKRFDAMIGVGPRWPVTTSLAAHLLNAHMGRLIEVHRGSSRSNDTLFRERYALQGTRVFDYMKMALGMVPFIGTAIALYDAWSAANQAVAAFLRGRLGDGLAEIESVLLCLVDALIDIVPTAGAALMARSATRVRLMRKIPSAFSTLAVPDEKQARRIVERFSGYEYEKPVSLAGLRPVNGGVWRNIYRHADGDFIVRQGRVYQVEWSRDSRNWRLSGTTRKTYKQPIALNEAGEWDTWFGVYGTTFEGGGAGGGNVLGHMADALEPLWPQALRERLPRWWVSRALRRQHQLTLECKDLGNRLDRQLGRNSRTLNASRDNPKDESLRVAALKAWDDDMALLTRKYRTAAELRPLIHGNKLRALIEAQSRNAAQITNRHIHRVGINHARIRQYLSEIESKRASLDALPKTSITDRLELVRNLRNLRVDMIVLIEEVELFISDMNRWYALISVRADKARLTLLVNDINERMDDFSLGYLKTSHRLESIKNIENIDDVSWLYLQVRARQLRIDMARALFNQCSLSEVSVNRAQRMQILGNCLETYARYCREMNQWTASYPKYFHMEEFEPLMTGIEAMAERARKAIDNPSPPRTTGQSTKKVFQTEDQQWLIGVENWEPRTRKRQFVVNHGNADREVWEQADNGKFRLLTLNTPPPAPSRDLPLLLADARKRLDGQPAYLAKVQGYAKRDMLPVDLEHMMVSEADDLSHRARDIEAMSPENPIIGELKSKADELRLTGRQLRTLQTLKSRKPTDGMLEDLLRQDAVEVRKVALMKQLRHRADGRPDHMQEYEIHDLSARPPRLLWYAHFHYNKPRPSFAEFEKAHLKLPEHRYLTHADDAALPYADIGKRSPVLPWFEAL